MLKLSSRSRYGIRAAFDLAFYARGGSSQVKDIAKRQGIPVRFLEQIFQDLKRAGLVNGKRGPRGGYHLMFSPKDIRVGDVLRALDGRVALASVKDKNTSGDITTHTVVESALRELATKVESCFDAMTLSDLCDRAESFAKRRPTGRYVYSI